MSTLKATNLQHASATSANITLGSDGSVAVGGGNLSPQTGFRNRVINGDMRIDQRNNGGSVNTNDSFPVDRFKMSFSGGGVIAGQRSTVAPAGFAYSTSFTVSTADSSIAAGDYYILQHRIEGNNTADLGFGTSTASQVAVSFWVRSSVTGTYAGALHNNNDTRCYVFNYSINSANTWEYKTIVVSGDTAGTWNTGTDTGINLILDFGSGTSFNGTVNSWNTTNVFRTSGSVNWIANSGATFYLTGVQVEKGSVATPYEFRSIGQELALCQRYCVTYGGTSPYDIFGIGFVSGATSVELPITLPVVMRTAPSLTLTAGYSFQVNDAAATPSTGTAALSAAINQTNSIVLVNLTSFSGGSLTPGRVCRVYSNNTTNTKMIFASEL